MLNPKIQKFLDSYFSFIRKYIPSQPQESSVGLDIGSQYCKAVEVVHLKKGFKVVNAAIEPVQEKDAVSSVKVLLKRMGSESRNVFTGLSGQGTLIRFIRMPRMPLGQLKESLLLEADKYFPFPSNEIYIDCQIIDDSKIKDNKMSVLVAVAKKDLIKERLQVLASLGLQGNFVGLSAIAIANAVMEGRKDFKESNPSSDDKKDALAVLEIGEMKTTAVIFRDHAPRFTREIAIGGRDFTQKIMGVLGLDFQAAEKIKCAPEVREAEVFQSCHQVLMNLLSEIRLSFDYFSSEDGARVSKIFLAGQGSRFAGLKDFLAKELEVFVETWKPAVDLECGEQVRKEEFLAQADQFCVALGLALTNND